MVKERIRILFEQRPFEKGGLLNFFNALFNSHLTASYHMNFTQFINDPLFSALLYKKTNIQSYLMEYDPSFNEYFQKFEIYHLKIIWLHLIQISFIQKIIHVI